MVRSGLLSAGVAFERWAKVDHTAMILWKDVLPVFIVLILSVATIVSVLVIMNRRLSANLRKIRENERTIRLANEHLKELSEEKSRLINMVGHDLRSPLSCLRMRTENFRLLHAGKMSADQVELLDGVEQDTSTMLHLVNRLLESERIDAAPELKLGPLAIGPMAKDLINRYLPHAQHKHLSFEQDIPDDLPKVIANRDALTRILDNLLGNAFKFTPAEGKVRLEIRLSEAGRVRFSVIDSGPGIPQEEMSQLFQKFARLSPKPTGGEPSSGLGLFIVKRLSDIIGAEVHCVSKVGNGSEFTVVCPTVGHDGWSASQGGEVG